MKTKVLNRIILMLFFATLSENIFAQQLYTLQNCIDRGLQNSLQLKSDGYDLAQTNASIEQAYSNLKPTISANAMYQYSPQVQTSLLPAETFGGPAGVYSAAKLGVAQSKSAGLQLTQMIYNASAIIGLKVAKVLVNGNALQIKSTKEDLVYNISATYYNIQSLMKQEELTQKIVNNTEQLLATTEINFKAGLVTQTDVDRLSVSRDNTKASLENLKNNKEKYFNLLKTLMNIPLDEKMVITDFNESDANNALLITPNFNPLLKTNYLQIMQNKVVTDLQRQNIKAGQKPSLALTANYALTGYYNEFNPFRNINSKFYPSSGIGLKLNVPIYDGNSLKYQMKSKEFELKKLDVLAEQTTQQNNRAVADASADLRSNFITYQNQQRNLILAQKVKNDIDVQYTNGIVKVTDVINTQNDLQTAQNNFVSALINIKQAELSLKKALGVLVE